MPELDEQPARSRSPGVWFGRGPSAAPAAGPAPTVAAFIGFAAPAAAGRLARFDHWDEAAAALLPEAPEDGQLAAAVQAFFANGGERCLVATVPREQGARGLIAALGPGEALADRTDVALVCVPDAVAAPEALHDVYRAALDHCGRAGDRFAVLDAPPPTDGTSGDAHVAALAGLAAGLRSPHGALYAPWLVRPADRPPGTSRASIGWRARAPVPARAKRPCPPSGHVAGQAARLDASVGPQRAPAGLPLDDAIDLATPFTPAQSLALEDARVNPLRRAAGGGVEVAGARTLTGHADRSFVPAARVIAGFRRWLATGMADLVFEPATPALWDRIAARLTARCRRLFADGALAGDDPARAFFVRCDAETNGADEVERGRVVALVGLAPSVPAEFVILRLAQAPGAGVVSSVVQSS